MDAAVYQRVRKLLLIGVVASLVTVVGGELPIGWVVYPEGENYLLSMLLSCRELSLLQLACGMFFGAIGIPLQYYGFEAVAQIVGIGGNERSGKLIHWGALACAFWGGIVHIVCVALMFLCKVQDPQTMVRSALDFFLWLVMPISAVFMPIYYAMTVAMLVVTAKGKTVFPRRAAVFNPLTAASVLNLLPAIAPNTALMNALNMANMGIGSLLTFGGLLLLLPKENG